MGADIIARVEAQLAVDTEPCGWRDHIVPELVAELKTARAQLERLKQLSDWRTLIFAPLEETGQPRWHEFYDDYHEGIKAAEAEGLPLGYANVSEWKVCDD
jgi:hypothetical protein